jgi:hypothetical protein
MAGPLLLLVTLLVAGAVGHVNKRWRGTHNKKWVQCSVGGVHYIQGDGGPGRGRDLLGQPGRLRQAVHEEHRLHRLHYFVLRRE